MAEQQRVKHVLDLLKKEGCPICYQNNEDVKRMFTWFLLEYYGTQPWVELLNRSRGFCSMHTWEVVTQHMPEQIRWPLGLTYLYIINYDLEEIRTVVSFLERYKLSSGEISVVRNKKLEKLIMNTVLLEPCPACIELKTSTTNALKNFLMYLLKPEIQKAYINSEGLCLPHLEQALNLAEGETLKELVNIHLPKLYLLRSQVPCGQERLFLLTGKRFFQEFTLLSSLEDKEICSTLNRPALNLNIKHSCYVCRKVALTLQGLWTTIVYKPQNWANRISEFCSRHRGSILIHAYLNNLDIAKEFQTHLLTSKIEELETLLAASEIKKDPKPPQICPACEVQNYATLKVLKTVADNVASSVNPRNYWKSLDLCMGHFRKLIPLASPAAIIYIGRYQQEKLKELLIELKEYFRKEDYRYKDEPKGNEQTAWLRAIELYCGFPYL